MKERNKNKNNHLRSAKQNETYLDSKLKFDFVSDTGYVITRE